MRVFLPRAWRFAAALHDARSNTHCKTCRGSGYKGRKAIAEVTADDADLAGVSAKRPRFREPWALLLWVDPAGFEPAVRWL